MLTLHIMSFATSLYRAKDSSTNIVVADDISEVSIEESKMRQSNCYITFATLLSFPLPQQLGELSYCCTKEELFSKLRELMEYKARCIELKEEVNRCVCVWCEHEPDSPSTAMGCVHILYFKAKAPLCPVLGRSHNLAHSHRAELVNSRRSCRLPI